MKSKTIFRRTALRVQAAINDVKASSDSSLDDLCGTMRRTNQRAQASRIDEEHGETFIRVAGRQSIPWAWTEKLGCI